MSLLIRLYPRPWRDRYEAEMVDLLEQQPTSFRSSLDLLRGAADAHLHPQAGPEIPWTWRLPGVVVALTGMLWIAAMGAAITGTADLPGALLGLGMLTMLIALPGDYVVAWRRRIVLGAASFAITWALAIALGWRAGTPFALAAYAILLGGTLTLVAIRAGIGAHERRILVLSAIGLPVVAMAAQLQINGQADWQLLAPIPVAWLLVGLRLTVRGAPTIVDSPRSSEPSPPIVEIPA